MSTTKTNQKKIKAILRHELLNILMVINVLIADEALEAGEKEQILDLTKLASLLLIYEDIFLGKKSKLFLQEVSLKEILEIVLAVHEKKIANHSVVVTLPENDFFVKTDKDAVKEALEQIVGKLLDSVSVMEFRFNSQANELVIIYEREGSLKIRKIPLMECLSKKALPDNEIGLQLALEILNINGIKFVLAGRKIAFAFPA